MLGVLKIIVDKKKRFDRGFATPGTSGEGRHKISGLGGKDIVDRLVVSTDWWDWTPSQSFKKKKTIGSGGNIEGDPRERSGTSLVKSLKNRKSEGRGFLVVRVTHWSARGGFFKEERSDGGVKGPEKFKNLNYERKKTLRTWI